MHKIIHLHHHIINRHKTPFNFKPFLKFNNNYKINQINNNLKHNNKQNYYNNRNYNNNSNPYYNHKNNHINHRYKNNKILII